MSIRSAKDLINVIDNRLWREHDSGKFQWRRHTARAIQIAYAVLRDLAEGHLSLRAMSLVYYTVIAIVPMLALTFAVIKGLGVHNAMEPALLGLLQPFMGEYSIQITDNVVSFVDNVRVDVLSVVSLGVLLYTVLTMMQQIELTFNYIWSITQPRTLAHRISEYLFAIIVSPLLILISVGIASSLNANFFVHYLEQLTFGAWIIQTVAFIMPALFMSLAFALAFVFIPNTRVRFSSAFIGGVVTMIAWKTMAFVFQNFIVINSANAVIYAAFFAVILLMLFLHLGWLMLLIGSSVAFYHQYPAKARLGRKPIELSFEIQEEIALSVAYLIVKRFSKGLDPWNVDELAAYTRISAPVIETAVNALMDAGFISATDDQPRCFLPHHSVEDSSVNALRKRLRERSGTKLDQKSISTEQNQIRQFICAMDEQWSASSKEITFRQLITEEPDSE